MKSSHRFLLAALLVGTINLSWPFSVFAAVPSKLVIGYAAMSARVMPLWMAEEQGILAQYGPQLLRRRLATEH
jgi:hypothetical protein